MPYLDHAAATPMRPAAIEAMLPWLAEQPGNPSGAHRPARLARRALDDARDRLAEIVGCRPDEVVFTSGGTEADNLAIAGVLSARPGAVVTSAIEHEAILNSARAWTHRIAPVGGGGYLDLEAFADLVGPDVALVSVMTANNEIGTVQPLAAVADVIADRCPGALLHTDAVQALTWLDLAELAARADLVSLSAHKVGGPKGSGALIVRRGVGLRAQLVGGGQEQERRSGTPNVAGAVAFAVAAGEAAAERAALRQRTLCLRQRFESHLAAIEGVTPTLETARGGDRLAGIVPICVSGLESEAMLFLLDERGVSASAASSCASGAQQRSHVLAAVGVAAARARGALRFSLGWSSTEADVDEAAQALGDVVTQLRRGEP